MTTRDEFEKWAIENWIDGLPKMIALKAWEASRALALEEAAKECESRQDYKFPHPESGYAIGYSDCAASCLDAIRALAKAEGEKQS